MHDPKVRRRARAAKIARPTALLARAFAAAAQVSGVTEVKASIKLRFRNNAGQTMVVVRGMQVQQKKATVTFKQMDGVIRTTNDRGEKGARPPPPRRARVAPPPHLALAR